MSRENETFEEALAHYGVKGMKWGVRKKSYAQVTTSHKPGKRVKATGGQYAGASKDAVRAAELKRRGLKSTTDSLTNKELQEAITRMNLEKQYNSLAGKTLRQRGEKFLADLLLNTGKQHATRTANEFLKK